MSRHAGQPYYRHELEPLLEFCVSDVQEQLLRALVSTANGQAGLCNLRQASEAIKKDYRGCQRTLQRIHKQAARAGWSPAHDQTHTVPLTQEIAGVSSYYGDDGELKAQWVKTRAKKEASFEEVRDSIIDVFDGYRGKSLSFKPPKATQRDVLAFYPMGDPHIGMYSWHQETGNDFDCDVAQRNLAAAMEHLVERTTRSHTCVIGDMGDFFHADNDRNMTPKSGNTLDIDTRWPRVFKIGVWTFIHLIHTALRLHRKVIVRCVSGNHDPLTSMALAIALECFFHSNKRVIIDTSPAPYWYHEFGKVMLVLAHGHEAPMKGVPGIVTCDQPEMWGRTQFRYYHQGHLHTKKVEEFPGITGEIHRTLAPNDRWHQGRYRSLKGAESILYHREYGEVERNAFNLGMIETS